MLNCQTGLGIIVLNLRSVLSPSLVKMQLSSTHVSLVTFILFSLHKVNPANWLIMDVTLKFPVN